MGDNERNQFQTRIWSEVAEPSNPFAAATCYCYGYDVYGEMLGAATWIEYLYLLFRGERPSEQQGRALEGLAIALANPGIREPSIHAAMCGGAGGSTNASCLIAALAVGAGNLGGAREVFHGMEYWSKCATDLAKWKSSLKPCREEREDVWPYLEHPPGFDPHGSACPTPVKQTLRYLASIGCGSHLPWLDENRMNLQRLVNAPLSMSGVAAAALVDLGFSPSEGEMMYLLLRLPGAAVHALEQRSLGWRRFPLFINSIHLTNDPGPTRQPSPQD